MAYIDSSLDSPLAAAGNGAAAIPQAEREDADTLLDTEDEAEEEEKPEREVRERRLEGTLRDRLIAQVEDINLARYLTDDELDQIGMDAVREFDIDENSRADWVDKAEKAMRYATQDAQKKEFPWPGASNVIWPLITQAAIEFHARTDPAVVQGRKVVKGVVWGEDRGTPAKDAEGKPEVRPGPDGQPQPVWVVEPGEKRQRADKIGEFMSWQLLTEMPEWEPQTDQYILQMAVAGGFVRKTYRDQMEGRNKSIAVSLMNVVWNYHAPSFEAAPRKSEKILVYPNEITSNERTEDDGDGGMWLPLQYAGGGGGVGQSYNYDREIDAGDESDPSAPHLFIEQPCLLDLDEDGYAEPYTVTVHVRSAKVVRIVARYDEEGIEASEDGETIIRIEPVECYTLYPFFPNIDGGSYPMGFGHMLRPMNDALSTTVNQMLDAGTLQNAGGGFISDQLNAPSGQTLFSVGKYHRVNTKGGAIRDAVFPLEFKGPSQVLFSLFGALMTASKEIASVANVLTGDAAIANAPPTTILALIEQGMKVYTAIHKRFFRAETAELAKLYRLNRKYITEDQRYQIGDEFREITPEDFRLGGGVEPIADPTMTTDMQKLGRAQLLMTLLETEDGKKLLDPKAVFDRMLEAANIDRISDLYIPPNPMAQQLQQLEMARLLAELGKTRATELKDQTQAYFNLARARAIASGPEEELIRQQLQMMRLHIEAINAQTNAALADHKFHDTATRREIADNDRLANLTAGGAGPSTRPVPA